MPDSKSTMYAKLFNAVTDAIHLLQKAQIETEEMCISQENAPVIQLRRVDNPQQKGESQK